MLHSIPAGIVRGFLCSSPPYLADGMTVESRRSVRAHGSYCLCGARDGLLHPLKSTGDCSTCRCADGCLPIWRTRLIYGWSHNDNNWRPGPMPTRPSGRTRLADRHACISCWANGSISFLSLPLFSLVSLRCPTPHSPSSRSLACSSSPLALLSLSSSGWPTHWGKNTQSAAIMDGWMGG